MILIDVPVPGAWDSQVYAFSGSEEEIRADIMARIPHPQNVDALLVYDQGLVEKQQRRTRIEQIIKEHGI